jgi:hypothetical protein
MIDNDAGPFVDGGNAACVAKQVTRPVRNREARVTGPQLA